MKSLLRVFRIKFLEMVYRIGRCFIYIYRSCRNRHFHFYRIVGKQGVNLYLDCRCDARKVTFPSRGFTPINTEWLAGMKDEL